MLLAVRLAIFHAMMLDGIHKISLCFIEHHRSDKQNQQGDPQPDHQVRYGNIAASKPAITETFHNVRNRVQTKQYSPFSRNL